MTDLPSYPSDAAEREAATPASAVRYASWGRRAVAYLIDSVVAILIFVAAFALPYLVLILLPTEDDASGIWVAIGLVFLVMAIVGGIGAPILYYTWLTGNERGQTWGKRVMGIRVVSASSGGAIGYGRAFGRYIITVVLGFFILPLVVDYLWPLWDSQNQSLHDKGVGSVVVRV